MSLPIIATLRQALLSVLPVDVSSNGTSPPLQDVYIPPAHLKALRLDVSLVIGARGVGKTFWSSVLCNPDTVQKLLHTQVPELGHTTVWAGFGVTPNLDAYPDSDTFIALTQNEMKSYDIWRAIVARPLATLLNRQIPTQDWAATSVWVQNNPEPYARLLQDANIALTQQQRYGLFVFDALDRTSPESDWTAMDDSTRDLLRVILKLKSYPRLAAKVFVREDQSMRAITSFPDASKLIATSATLDWAINDLHGLLWQTLINAPKTHGQMLRKLYQEGTGCAPVQIESAWQVDDKLKRDAALQRKLFEILAGKMMGSDARRGVPYVWIVSHLADGHGRTSPRSFLAAVRAATEDSENKYPNQALALHHESIRRGVQKASEIRVKEITEDYQNVGILMAPLRGLSVPCEFIRITERWHTNVSNPELDLGTAPSPSKQLQARSWTDVRDDLIRLGIFEIMQDGRINMPDLYRVGFNLGRRGGVKPLKPR